MQKVYKPINTIDLVIVNSLSIAGKINLKTWYIIIGIEIKKPNTTAIPIFIKKILVIFNTWKETFKLLVGKINNSIILSDSIYPTIEKKIIDNPDFIILFLNSEKWSKNDWFISISAFNYFSE